MKVALKNENVMSACVMVRFYTLPWDNEAWITSAFGKRSCVLESYCDRFVLTRVQEVHTDSLVKDVNLRIGKGQIKGCKHVAIFSGFSELKKWQVACLLHNVSPANSRSIGTVRRISLDKCHNSLDIYNIYVTALRRCK